ncbi:peptidase M61 [Flavobacteriaceae bacterium F08102]|nr:peptidase M61 [Flavobacteriaceae bacterium F08102]
MKKIVLIFCVGLVLASCGTSKATLGALATASPIHAELNLMQVNKDKVPVVINPGRFSIDTVIYRMPRVVQGTYAVSNFGSFIEGFKALDYEGNTLTVEKSDVNSWKIYPAKSLDKISYLVNDTFDIEKNPGQETPFSPSGTNIEPENYVLNLHGFIGYFDHLKNSQYQLDVISPVAFKRTSALQKTNEKISEDGASITVSYFAPRYFDITDNPMMYGNLDVEEFTVGDMNIVLSLYSPNKVHSAKVLKETIERMMQAQKAYLGDINTTSRYDIYVYLAENTPIAPTGFGALEHHTSTVVVLPENLPLDVLKENLIDVVSHEFFHIVTPLSVHSEDVHYFDYNQPTFSKHLWMYEGVTEYFATLFQVDQGLFTEDQFYTKILEKINTAKGLDDTMSFTEMSENILDKPYADNYYNVYQKGALIGMCIDILMREESHGERGILSLMKELSLRYGKNKPFEDDKLIDIIVAMTYPSIRTFFDRHVIGTTPIDYAEYFKKVGLKVVEGQVKTGFARNGANWIFQGSLEKGIFFNDLVKNNSFWNEAGVQPNDVLKRINGQEVTLQNAEQIIGEIENWKEGIEVNIVLDRNGQKVEFTKTVSPSFMPGEKLTVDPNATPTQNTLRASWLKG